MLKFTHFESLENLWKQLFLLVPHSALDIAIATNSFDEMKVRPPNIFDSHSNRLFGPTNQTKRGCDIQRALSSGFKGQ